MTVEPNLQTILKSMNPIFHEGEYVFCTVENTEAIDPNDLVMTFRETEGTTLIIRKETADKLNLKYDFIAAWISLMVHSSLEAVGLTASFSTALADEGISCNVVAGYYHDHLFIKHSDSQKAIAVLEKLSL
ncbi:MAG: ACT domain-containing protein [Prolixibacteraceae bacterium]|nr:ACT domain-containing protein [Prolixibacteraceae bacterium]